jgi:hypothetical protein
MSSFNVSTFGRRLVAVLGFFSVYGPENVGALVELACYAFVGWAEADTREWAIIDHPADYIVNKTWDRRQLCVRLRAHLAFRPGLRLNPDPCPPCSPCPGVLPYNTMAHQSGGYDRLRTVRHTALPYTVRYLLVKVFDCTVRVIRWSFEGGRVNMTQKCSPFSIDLKHPVPLRSC